MSSKRRTGFKFGQYLTEKTDTVITMDSQRIVVSKGDVTKTIDLSDLRELLKRLKTNKNLQVSKISGSIKEDYKTLVSHVTVLYDTDEYKVLFDEVKNIFNDVNEKNIKPGTIGAYCAGCILNADKGCSVLCNGALPKPKTEDSLEYCDYPVIWAKYENGKYTFTGMNKSPKNEVMIYLEATSPFAFSQEEKQELKRLGFSKVKLVHSPMDGNTHKEITGEFIEIDKLELRVPGNQNVFTDRSPENKNHVVHQMVPTVIKLEEPFNPMIIILLLLAGILLLTMTKKN